ncbi:MAG: hypothetical protein L3J07_02885 [Candidatus Magasanikbacteria bacterium]|nr:hypothetical protein [Candidatus Magasanikbacteria bacterium]
MKIDTLKKRLWLDFVSIRRNIYDEEFEKAKKKYEDQVKEEKASYELKIVRQENQRLEILKKIEKQSKKNNMFLILNKNDIRNKILILSIIPFFCFYLPIFLVIFQSILSFVLSFVLLVFIFFILLNFYNKENIQKFVHVSCENNFEYKEFKPNGVFCAVSFNPNKFKDEFDKNYYDFAIEHNKKRLNELESDLFGNDSDYQKQYKRIEFNLSEVVRLNEVLSVRKNEYQRLNRKIPKHINLAIYAVNKYNEHLLREQVILRGFKIDKEEYISKTRVSLEVFQQTTLPDLKIMEDVRKLVGDIQEISDEVDKILEKMSGEIAGELEKIRQESEDIVRQVDIKLALTVSDFSEGLGLDELGSVLEELVDVELEEFSV